MSAFGSDSGTHIVAQLRRIADALEKMTEQFAYNMEKVAEHMLVSPSRLSIDLSVPRPTDSPDIQAVLSAARVVGRSHHEYAGLIRAAEILRNQ